MKNQFILLFSVLFVHSVAQESGIQISNMNRTANPANDFYEYCNGNWQKSFKLPESDSRYGSFNEINDNNLKNIKLILDEAAANKSAPANSNAQKLRDFYITAIDTLKAEKLSYEPIKPQLNAIEKVKTIDQFLDLKTEFDYYSVNLLFSGGVSADLKNSKRTIFGIGQGGFGLGNRDFYYEPQFENIRNQYTSYISELFVLIGNPISKANEFAKTVVEFEKKLCNKALTSLEMRDMERMYNPHSKKQLKDLSPLINWEKYFKNIQINQPDTVIVMDIIYFKELNDLLKNTNIEILKTYAKAQLLMESSSYLSKNFVIATFDFRGKKLSGAKTMKPRWERANSVIDRFAGDLVSQEYVKKYFPPQSKEKVLKMIDNLIIAYRERIASRTWMVEETKKEAYRKLDLLIKKVGYPDKWKDYSKLNITTESYWKNVCAASKLMVQEAYDEIKKPVDRNKWLMTPITVNAYYEPSNNEITFPAAILQPPFFNPNADDAANYGTMGAIIGHELTHGFDDQGSQFNADGNMQMWWSKEDYANFKSKTKLIIEQFNNYKVLDSIPVKGEMTQGENIADLGGLTMAYYAYKKTLNGKASPVMNELTGEQRFFIAWAQGWKQIARPEEIKRLITVDYHSPAQLRAVGPLSNLKEFYQAFNVKEGDKMFTPDNRRVEIW